MRFQRVSKAVVVGAAMALALSACAPGGPEESKSSDAPTTEASQSGGGTEATTTGLADLGDITTKDDTIKVSVGAPEFISYNGFTPQTYSTYN